MNIEIRACGAGRALIRRTGDYPAPRARLLILACLAGPLSSCTHILPQETAYYEDGPRQAQQSEGDFPAGTKALLLLGRQDDYVQVWADSGVIAYVWKGSVISLRDWNRQEDERKRKAELEQRQRELDAGRADQQGPPASAPAPSEAD